MNLFITPTTFWATAYRGGKFHYFDHQNLRRNAMSNFPTRIDSTCGLNSIHNPGPVGSYPEPIAESMLCRHCLNVLNRRHLTKEKIKRDQIHV